MKLASGTDPSLVGVVGYPIAHSKSPRMHNYWLKRHDIDGYYVPLKVSREDFPSVLKILPKMGFRGVNVTIPHKETALQHSDNVSDQAALIGAANTLTFQPSGTVYADNTDGYGFLGNLRQHIPNWRADAGPALVYGAGGAARAIIYSLISEGAPAIFIVNRTRDRAEVLRSEFGNRLRVTDEKHISDLLPEITTLVNTSALGMKGKPDLRFPPGKVNPNMAVADIVYTPPKTGFLEEAEQAGCKIVDGLGMLLHQAAASFNFWYGIWPDVDNELRSLVLGE